LHVVVKKSSGTYVSAGVVVSYCADTF